MTVQELHEQLARDNVAYYERLDDQIAAHANAGFAIDDGFISWAHAWHEAWSTNDPDGVGDCVTEDCVWEDPTFLGAQAQGRARVRDYAAMVFTAVPDLRFDPVGLPLFDLTSDRPRVLQAWRGTGTFTGPLKFWPPLGKSATVAPTGRGVDFRGTDYYEFRDGKVAYGRTVYDLLEVVIQVGLLPHPNGDLARPLLSNALKLAALAARALA